MKERIGQANLKDLFHEVAEQALCKLLVKLKYIDRDSGILKGTSALEYGLIGYYAKLGNYDEREAIANIAKTLGIKAYLSLAELNAIQTKPALIHTPPFSSLSVGKWWEMRCAPIRKISDNCVELALINPLRTDFINKLSFEFDIKLQLAIASEDDLRDFLNRQIDPKKISELGVIPRGNKKLQVKNVDEEAQKKQAQSNKPAINPDLKTNSDEKKIKEEAKNLEPKIVAPQPPPALKATPPTTKQSQPEVSSWDKPKLHDNKVAQDTTTQPLSLDDFSFDPGIKITGVGNSANQKMTAPMAPPPPVIQPSEIITPPINPREDFDGPLLRIVEIIMETSVTAKAHQVWFELEDNKMHIYQKIKQQTRCFLNLPRPIGTAVQNKIKELVKNQSGEITISLGKKDYSFEISYDLTPQEFPLISFSTGPKHILVISADPKLQREIEAKIRSSGYTCTILTDPDLAFDQLTNQVLTVDLVISSISFANYSIMQILSSYKKLQTDCQLIFIVDSPAEEKALKLLNIPAGQFFKRESIGAALPAQLARL